MSFLLLSAAGVFLPSPRLRHVHGARHPYVVMPNERRAARHASNRFEALKGIAGVDVPRCVCCGERRVWALVFDHIEGGGHAERAAAGGQNTLQLIVSERRASGEWPRHRFQVLCALCNHGRRVNGGACPHSNERVLFMHTRDRIVAGVLAASTALVQALVAFDVLTGAQSAAVSAVFVAFAAGYRMDRGAVKGPKK